MLSIEQCREELGETAQGMTDEQVKEVRDSLYSMAELALDTYIERCNMKQMRTRATAVVVREGKLLMMHRFNNGEEYWVLPGGGVEEGEDVNQAVLRELQEETSIEAKLKENLLEFTDPRGDKHSLFLCEYISGVAQLREDSVEANNKDEHQSYSPEWVEVDKIPELTIYPVEEKVFLTTYLKLG